MDKDICLHAIYAESELYNSKVTLRILKQILESKALLSARLRNDMNGRIFYNGLDYISLCDYAKKDINFDQSAYDNYICYSLSLMFPKEALPIINPIIIPFNGVDEAYFSRMEELGLSKTDRYSDMPDEVQVKDSIPLKLMTGITLPVKRMSDIILPEAITCSIVYKQINKINELLTQYGYQLPIYDIDTFELLHDELKTKKLIKHYIKKKEI